MYRETIYIYISSYQDQDIAMQCMADLKVASARGCQTRSAATLSEAIQGIVLHVGCFCAPARMFAEYAHTFHPFDPLCDNTYVFLCWK